MRLPKAYQPNDYEPNIYAMWESADAFSPRGEGEPYSIVMPPPNSNGNLHLGHALMATIEDILTRFYRMKGRDVIYLPGADHAGFETWVVYEKVLEEKKKSRFDFSREQLYSQVWNFVDKKRADMDLQLRALGVSASWKDLVFTLDEKVVKTTYSTFKKLWDEGLIYRGERIVNYCTTHQTSFADIEVVHKNEKGKLYNIAYPTIDRIDEITIATTRPETMLGDVAVAVHPDDKRYKHLVGSHVLLPLTDREVPIIADEYVDPTYGTGAVKITPAHDPNDFEIGMRHNLDNLQVIDFNGKMINVPPQFLGISPKEARMRVLAALQAQELLRGDKEIEHAVGHCYKCGSVIEPLVKEQWFLHVRPLADAAKEALERGDIRFVPARKKDELIRYYDSLKDWNLSRQIPWGIPIPAFQNISDPNDWIYNERVDEPQIVIDGKTYRREEDTFDTWFSSGQWPFITTDVLTEGDLARFYPLSLMETGHDILYPWVSRMIMLGLKITGRVPFKEVYLHGLVLDEHGQKMSKSKGNVINPMEILSEYGSDALRLGIVASRSAGHNQAFSTNKVVAGRNFCNKLWNIARYTEDKLGEDHMIHSPEAETLADHWIVRELTSAANNIEALLADYRFAEAAEVVYHTIWSSLADWYIEASKNKINRDMLAWTLDTALRISHPFAPFVTETIYQTLPWYKEGSLLINASWPEQLAYDEIAAAEFDRLQEVVSEIRFTTAELPGNDRYELTYGSDSLVQDNAELIQRLAKLKSVTKTFNPAGLRIASQGREAWLNIDEETLYEHQSNLEIRLEKAYQRQKSLNARLDNPAYTEKAPAHLVEATREELKEVDALIERLRLELEVIGSD